MSTTTVRRTISAAAHGLATAGGILALGALAGLSVAAGLSVGLIALAALAHGAGTLARPSGPQGRHRAARGGAR